MNIPKTVSSNIPSVIKKNTFLNKHRLKIIAAIIFIVVVLAVIFKKQITNFFKPTSENEIKEPVIVISGGNLKKNQNSNKVENFTEESEESEEPATINAKLTKDFKISVTLNITMFGEFIDELRIKRTGGNLTGPQYKDVEPDTDGETPYRNKPYTVDFTPLPNELMLGVFKFEIEYKNPANTDYTKIGDTYTLSEITTNEISLTNEMGEYPLAVNAEAGPVTAITDFKKKETRFFTDKDGLDFLENSEPYYLSPVEGRKSSFKITYMNDISTQLTVYEVDGVKIAFFETPGLKKTVLWTGMKIFSKKVTDRFYLRDVNGKKIIALDTGGDYNSPNPDILIKSEIDPETQTLQNITTLMKSNNFKYVLAEPLRSIKGEDIITKAFVSIHKDFNPKLKALANKIDPDSVRLFCDNIELTDSEHEETISPYNLGQQFINSIIRYGSTGNNFDEARPWCGVNKKGNNLRSHQCAPNDKITPGWRHGVGSAGATVPVSQHCSNAGKSTSSVGINYKLKTDSVDDAKRKVRWQDHPNLVSKKGYSPNPRPKGDRLKHKGGSIGECRQTFLTTETLTDAEKDDIKIIGHINDEHEREDLRNTCFYYTSAADDKWTYEAEDWHSMECKDPTRQWPCADP